MPRTKFRELVERMPEAAQREISARSQQMLSESGEVDSLGRPFASTELRQAIANAFTGVEGRGALVVIADADGTRGHLAAKLGNGWKVAAGGGFTWQERKPAGFIALMHVW